MRLTYGPGRQPVKAACQACSFGKDAIEQEFILEQPGGYVPEFIINKH